MKTALLVIDMQNAILAGKAGPGRQDLVDRALDATAARLAALAQRARRAAASVVLIQHDGEAGHRLARGSDGWRLRAEFAPQPGDLVVHKTACDAFFRTDLAERLAKAGATRLAIGGCMTEFCVDTTARRAVSLGYPVVLISDGHMTGDTPLLPFAEIVAHHNATLDGFDAGEAVIELRSAAEIVF